MIGVSPAVAITSGAIDSFVGNAVQAILLILLLVFSEATLTLHFSLPAAPGIQHLLYLLIAIGVIALALAVLRIGRMARAGTRAHEAVAAWLPQVRDAIKSLRRSQQLAQLLLGSVATEVLFATALGMFARGMGFPLSLAELLVINMSVSLFASFIPVPGGIGIVEGGLAVGLTAAGLPESSAFATALLYRIATFYLPPFWGWFALQWLRRTATCRRSRPTMRACGRRTRRTCRAPAHGSHPPAPAAPGAPGPRTGRALCRGRTARNATRCPGSRRR